MGLRHIDTARIFGNERDVADGLRDSGLPRSPVFVNTRLSLASDRAPAKLALFEKPSPEASCTESESPCGPCSPSSAEARLKALSQALSDDALGFGRADPGGE